MNVTFVITKEKVNSTSGNTETVYFKDSNYCIDYLLLTDADRIKGIKLLDGNKVVIYYIPDYDLSNSVTIDTERYYCFFASNYNNTISPVLGQLYKVNSAEVTCADEPGDGAHLRYYCDELDIAIFIWLPTLPETKEELESYAKNVQAIKINKRTGGEDALTIYYKS